MAPAPSPAAPEPSPAALEPSPAALERGEHLLAGIDMVRLGYECTEHVATSHATHLVLTK